MTKPSTPPTAPFLSPETAPTPLQGAGLGSNPTPAQLEAFFRAAPPLGRSRESRIVLDGEGRFSQDGEPFEHAKLAQAFHTWIGRHPDDGRYILSNGLDWSYFEVADAPFFVRQLREQAQDGGTVLVLSLSDGTEEVLDPSRCRIAASGALYTQTKHDVRGGPFEAKFTRHAQTALAPYLVPGASESATPALRIGTETYPLGG